MRSFTGDVSIDTDGWYVHNGVLRSAGTAMNFDTAFKRSGYDVDANASAFDFPKWRGSFPAKSIDVPASVQLKMRGPQNGLDTHIVARSNAGNVTADLVLDSTVPGWKGKGRANLSQFDISQWLPTETQSDLTGVADFDLLLGIGLHFPRGPFTFAGPHVVYAGYEARDMRAKGTLVVDRVMVDNATLVASGSPVRATGWIDIPEPYGFHLAGHATHLDLRQLPDTIPVPHMRSDLTLDYDSTGRFANPVLVGRATFDGSTFLDMRISGGARGTVDTSGPRVAYSGIGEVRDLDIGQIGQEFDLATLRDPQFAGKVAGRFDLSGAGTSLDDLTIDVKGTDAAAMIFGGQVHDGQLDLQIRNDSLAGSGSGQFQKIDSAILTADSRIVGTLNGGFDLKGSLPGLFSAGFNQDLSQLSGSVTLSASQLKGIDIESAAIAGDMDRGLASVSNVEAKTAIGRASGKGKSACRGENRLHLRGRNSGRHAPARVPSSQRSGAGTFRGRVVGPLTMWWPTARLRRPRSTSPA